MPVRVNDEPVHSHAYQMIKRESNQRLLKNGDERFRQFVRQWTQARAKTRCQNECLSDFVHEQKIERFLDFARNDKRSVPYDSLSQIKRPGAEVDDAVVPSQRFRTEQPGNRRRSFQQSVVNKSFQVYHAHLLAGDID